MTLHEKDMNRHVQYDGRVAPETGSRAVQSTDCVLRHVNENGASGGTISARVWIVGRKLKRWDSWDALVVAFALTAAAWVAVATAMAAGGTP